MATGAQLLQGVPSYCVAFDCARHSFQLPCASVDTLWLCAFRSELELRLPTKEVLGERDPVALIHAGHLQHPY
jgi:hypothetical protein